MPESIRDLERYRIEETFEGGQSTVHKARDTVLGRDVALRTPNDATRSDPRRLDRFLESARALASIHHENVLKVHDVHVQDPIYLATEWMDVTLETVMAEQRLAVGSAIHVIEKTLAGLAAIHLAGLVHRDVQPSNILLSFDGETVKVGDLGGAEGTIGDSAQFAAPEALAADGTIGARADLYSVGLIAYELLLGREEFEAQFPEVYAATDPTMRHQRWVNWHQDTSRTVPSLCEVKPAISPAVSEVVDRLLAKDPVARFPDADSAIRALRAATGTINPISLPYSESEGQSKPKSESSGRILGLRPPWTYVALGGAILLAVVAVLVMNAVATSRAKHAANEAGKAMLQAKAEAQEQGADQEPLVSAYDGAAESQRLGAAAYKQRDYEESLKRFEQSTRLYRESIPQAHQRHAEFARDAAVAARAEAEEQKAETLPGFAEAKSALDRATKSLETKQYQAAGGDFGLAKEGFEQAALEARAVRARKRVHAAREAVEQAGLEEEEQGAFGITLEATGEGQFLAREFADAELSFTKAAEAYETALAEAPEPGDWPSGSKPTVFELGSTDTEKGAALLMCRQYADDCDPSWYASETLREAVLTPFTIDPTEVTNAQFDDFVRHTGYVTDAEKERARVYLLNGEKYVHVQGYTWREPGGERSSYQTRLGHPVVNVTRNDATAYCRAVQGLAGPGRLPTEDEWEAVARGRERRIYPWGNDWDPSRAHGMTPAGPGTHDVGTLPAGTTPTGMSDLAGNVWEWTSTVDPKGLVLKGGSYLESNPANLRAAVRRTDDHVSAFPDTGFRCAYDLSAW